MASPFDPRLMQELVNRELAAQTLDEKRRADIAPESHSAAPAGMETTSPMKAMLLGQALDSASTYAFLKQGRHESNPALQYMNKSAASVIPSAVAGGAGYALLYKALHKSHPKAADTLAGLLGGYHMALGASNLEGPSKGENSYSAVVRDLAIKPN